VIADEWEYELRESPELATTIGDYRYNDRWSDLSLERVEQQKRDTAGWLARFEAIETAGFPEQESLNHRLMVRNLRESLEGLEFKDYEMPVDQMDGLHLMFAQFVGLLPFATAEHYERYLRRLQALPQVLEQITGVLRQGEKDGLMPPRFLLEKTVEQCRTSPARPGKATPSGAR